MSQERNIEVKVGALILSALALLAGLTFAMGGISFQPTYRVQVDFGNPGGLTPGAPVRLAGVQVGKITEIEFRGAAPEALAGGALVRVITEIEQRYQGAIKADSRWFVSAHGVLGEAFLAIEPGSAEQPVLQDGAVVRGISPPRLDLLLSETYELLHRTYLGITNHEDKLRETFDGLHQTLTGTGQFFERNATKLDAIADNLESLTQEANETLRAARQQYVDNPRIERILGRIEATTVALERDVPPLLRDARMLTQNLDRTAAVLGSDAQLQRYQQITRNTEEMTEEAQRALRDARRLIDDVRSGKGTVGMLLRDEAMYDDIQELLRDLKQHPWKMFWRE